jgi:Arc/MetJ-type ribon-helix-helix transcriptional regulator
MSKLDPIDEFVREQLASGRFSDYDALVRYALASLKNRQSEIDEIAEELRPAVEPCNAVNLASSWTLKTSNKKVVSA